jgi:hypothetical protein
MSELKPVLNESFSEIWKKDIRKIADLLTEHLEDPEMLLKTLASFVQEARNEGLPKDPFH